MDRRKEDVHLQTLIGMVEKNAESIDVLQSKLEDHIESEEDDIKRMSDKIEPVLDLMHDIAAVGKFGRWLKQIVIWLAVVGGAVVAAFEWFEHLGSGK